MIISSFQTTGVSVASAIYFCQAKEGQLSISENGIDMVEINGKVFPKRKDCEIIGDFDLFRQLENLSPAKSAKSKNIMLDFDSVLETSELVDIVTLFLTTLSGLTEQEISPFVVVHRDRDAKSCHCHILLPSYNLVTGKAIDLYFDKTDWNLKSCLQQYINRKWKLPEREKAKYNSFSKDESKQKELEMLIKSAENIIENLDKALSPEQKFKIFAEKFQFLSQFSVGKVLKFQNNLCMKIFDRDKTLVLKGNFLLPILSNEIQAKDKRGKFERYLEKLSIAELGEKLKELADEKAKRLWDKNKKTYSEVGFSRDFEFENFSDSEIGKYESFLENFELGNPSASLENLENYDKFEVFEDEIE